MLPREVNMIIINLNRQIQCQEICTKIQRLVEKEENKDFSDAFLLIQIKRSVESGIEEPLAIESKND
jgi:hypothetical protein